MTRRIPGPNANKTTDDHYIQGDGMQQWIDLLHTVPVAVGMVFGLYYWIARYNHRRSVDSLSWVPTPAFVTKRQQTWHNVTYNDGNDNTIGFNHCIVFYNYVFNEVSLSHSTSWSVQHVELNNEMEPSLAAYAVNEEITIFVDPHKPNDTALYVQEDTAYRNDELWSVGIGVGCVALVLLGLVMQADLATSWRMLQPVVHGAVKYGFFAVLAFYIYVRYTSKRLTTVSTWQPSKTHVPAAHGLGDYQKKLKWLCIGLFVLMWMT
jgi:hypothetical protein